MSSGPDERERLKQHYEALERAELARQGREHLEGHAAARAKRAHALLWSVVRGLVIGAVIAGLGLSLLVLWQMQVAGQRFAEIRQAAMEAYSSPDDGDHQ